MKLLKGSAKLFGAFDPEYDNEDWNENFEPSSYDDADGMEDYTISWSINLQNVNLGIKLLNDNNDLKAAVFNTDVEISLIDEKGKEEVFDRLQLEVIRQYNTNPMFYLSFQSPEGLIHYFNITQEVNELADKQHPSDEQALIEAARLEVIEDADQEGMFCWYGSDTSCASKELAEDALAFEITSVVMGFHNKSSDYWEALSLSQKCELVREVY